MNSIKGWPERVELIDRGQETAMEDVSELCPGGGQVEGAAVKSGEQLVDREPPQVSVTREIPSNLTDLVPVGGVGQQIAQDLPHRDLVQHGGLHGLQLKQSAIDDDVRVRAAEVVAPVEDGVGDHMLMADCKVGLALCEQQSQGGDVTDEPIVHEPQVFVEPGVGSGEEERRLGQVCRWDAVELFVER